MRRGIAAAAMLTLALSACGKSSEPKATEAPASAAPVRAVTATLAEWNIGLDGDTASSGDVTFTVKNAGKETHEFVIFKTDLDPGKLPTGTDGSVDEEGKGVEHITEVEDVEKGKSTTLKATLDPGKYVLICNRVEDDEVHYKLGMRTGFTVE